ncbi:MAG: FAD-dependent oxidoreductase [Chitinophagales bacterium]|nr:FAD-dependent oxidoreductase [Chitinophagales bacterium]
MNTFETDYIIVGAGYAGIAAASVLHSSGKNFVIVEARERIGGRVNTITLPNSNTVIDVGAQWIGPTQHKIWDWVYRHKVETVEGHDTGKNIFNYKGKTIKYSGTIPKIDPLSLIDLGIAMKRIDNMAKSINVETPWSHPKAEEWDGITMNTWIRRNSLTAKARLSLNIGLETVFACQSSEISLLHFLFYCKSGDNLDALLAVTNGAQQTLFVNGAQHLLEQEVQPFKDKIILNQPVKSIYQDDKSVIARTKDIEIKGKRIILALSPAMCQKIHFEQALPKRKAQLLQRVPMGAAMKCFGVYEKPFWRDKNFSGQIVSDRTPFHVSFDCSKKDGRGIFLFFVEGENARDFIELPENVRKEKFLQEVAKYYGNEALHPIDYIDKCWTEEEYSGGCYTGNMTPGSWVQFGASLRAVTGRIHWAGTETATQWSGYMDGAIQSGYRTAQEVLQMSET